MGVPVIISDIPGPIDGMLKDKTGLVVPCKDDMALTKAMEKIIDSPNLCKAFAENGVEYVRNSFEQSELFRRIHEDRKDLLVRHSASDTMKKDR